MGWTIIGALLISGYTGLLLLLGRIMRPKGGNARLAFWLSAGLVWAMATYCAITTLLPGQPLVRIKGAGWRGTAVWVVMGLATGVVQFYMIQRVATPMVTRLLPRLANMQPRGNTTVDNMDLLRLYARPSFLVFAFATNLLEEFLWRGYLMEAVTGWFGSIWIAMLISAAAYGSYHFAFGPRDAFLNGLNGGMYALLYVLSGTLLASMVAHWAYNWLAFGSIRRAVAIVEARERGAHFVRHRLY
jgi:membrane protease YdiL (CAAX protease family)